MLASFLLLLQHVDAPCYDICHASALQHYSRLGGNGCAPRSLPPDYKDFLMPFETLVAANRVKSDPFGLRQRSTRRAPLTTSPALFLLTSFRDHMLHITLDFNLALVHLQPTSCAMLVVRPSHAQNALSNFHLSHLSSFPICLQQMPVTLSLLISPF